MSFNSRRQAEVKTVEFNHGQDGGPPDADRNRKNNLTKWVQGHRLSPRGEAAYAAIAALAKVSRSYLIYEPHNQAILSFLEEMKRAFLFYQSNFGEMVLEIRPFDLVLGSEVVYQEMDREISLSFKLFRDRVRRLTIERDVTWEELTRLLEILSIRYVGVRLNPMEDDILTHLLKSNFKSINILAVNRLVADAEQESLLGGGDEVSSLSSNQSFPNDFDRPLPDFSRREWPQYKPVSLEMKTALREERTHVSLSRMTEEVLEELLNLIIDPWEPLDFEEAKQLIREIRDFILADVDIKVLISIYQMIDILQEVPEDDSTHQQLVALKLSFVNEEAMGRLLRSLPRTMKTVPAELLELLKLMREDPLPMLLELLSEEYRLHVRALLRQLLISLLPGRQDAIIEHYERSDGRIAADLLRVLVEGASELSSPLIGNLVRSGSVEAQLEFIQLLKELPLEFNPRSQLILLLKSESHQVRIATLQMMCQMKEQGALRPLLRHCRTHPAITHGLMPEEELIVLGQTMAIINGELAFKTFQSWCLRPWYRPVWTQHARSLQRVGLEGIAMMNDPRAQQVMHALSVKMRGELQQRVKVLLSARSEVA